MRKMRNANAPWYPKVLIVCPGTLIENWKDELNRWGWWHVDVYHGDSSSREAALQAAASGRLEILITTYATYRINRIAINMVEWDCVIADECHQFKGRRSETTTAMNEINALCRIGLTGTAIQNSYDELWTLLNWTNPGKFGPISTWKTSISDPLRAGQSHDATNYQLSRARKTAKALVQNLLPQFFLRRMKSLIADQLPKKSDRVVFCPLTESQAEAYERYLESDTIRFIKESTEPCSCDMGKKAGWCCQQFLPNGSKWQSHVFPSIYHLQRLANHLATLIPQSSDPKDKQEKDLEMLQIAMPDRWRELYRTRDSILNYGDPEFCGKWAILKKLLRFWHLNGDKVLVFSHSVRLLKMLQMLFQHTSYNVSYLDGQMPYHERSNVVADFNSDPDQFVFLISTKAGGVGLNITSANKVVVVDPNWNPAYDLQAQDRAYRIGQVRDVEVFRLVSAGTIEEIVYARQIYKQQQANIGYTASSERRYFKGVQEDKNQKGEIFGLANLFNYQHENLLLRDIVNKTNVAESKAGVSVANVVLDGNDSFAQGSRDDAEGDSFLDRLNDATQSSDGDHGGEERAMSQLAALLVDEAEEEANGSKAPKRKSSKTQGSSKSKSTSRKANPILAILSSAGVDYSHENSEVIGPSAVESRLSRRAVEQAALDGELGDNYVFAHSSNNSSSLNPQTDPLPTLPAPAPPHTNHISRSTGRTDDDEDDNGHQRSRTVKASPDLPYKYQPLVSVRKRHITTMARLFGFRADVVAFACVVEGWTQEERRRALERFYTMRRDDGFGTGGIVGEGGVVWRDGVDVAKDKGTTRTNDGTKDHRNGGQDHEGDEVAPGRKEVANNDNIQTHDDADADLDMEDKAASLGSSSGTILGDDDNGNANLVHTTTPQHARAIDHKDLAEQRDHQTAVTTGPELSRSRINQARESDSDGVNGDWEL